MSPTIHQQAKRHIAMTKRINFSTTKKAMLILGIVALTLYVTLFSMTPMTHDFFHEFRHGLMLIPCH